MKWLYAFLLVCLVTGCRSPQVMGGPSPSHVWVSGSGGSGGSGSTLTPTDAYTAIRWSLDEDGGVPFLNSGTGGTESLSVSSGGSPACISNMPGKFGADIWCPNANTYVASATPATVEPCTNEMTVSLWVWPHSFPGDSGGLFGKQYYASGTWSSPFLSISFQEGSGSANGLWLGGVAIVGQGLITATMNPSVGYQGRMYAQQWNFLAVQADGAHGSLTIWWDAQLSGLSTYTPANIDWGTAHGRWMVGGFPDGPPFTDSYIDEIRVDCTARCPTAYLNQQCPYLTAVYQAGR